MAKILVECERLRYPKSGIATVCRSLIYGLQYAQPSFQYKFYGPPQEISADRHQILKFEPWHKMLPPATTGLQLIHVTHQLSDYFHKKTGSQKKMVTLHDLNFLHENLPEQKIKKRIDLVQKNIGNADTIVCISEFSKTDFVRNIDLFRLNGNVEISVVHNGLIFPQVKEFKAEKLNSFRDLRFILNIGVLFPKKNQLVLLDLLVDNDLQLVLVSSDSKSEYSEIFLDKMKALNLENRVHIIKDAGEEEKNFLLKHCESYVHPSVAEGFGIPPIEAMSFGKPVFLSTSTSLPEIGGDAAFYFSSFEPEEMRRIYRDGMKAYNKDKAEYISRIKSHAQNFNAQKMAAGYIEQYAKLLA